MSFIANILSRHWLKLLLLGAIGVAVVYILLLKLTISEQTNTIDSNATYTDQLEHENQNQTNLMQEYKEHWEQVEETNRDLDREIINIKRKREDLKEKNQDAKERLDDIAKEKNELVESRTRNTNDQFMRQFGKNSEQDTKKPDPKSTNQDTTPAT